MTWDQIRQADRSGWVEIASHTHDLHRYETHNLWRDTAPSVTVRRYLLKESRYENRDEYRSRVRADLLESQRMLVQQLGHDVSVLVWPYGEYNQAALSLAAQAGFSATLALGWREVRYQDLAARCLPRILVTRELSFRGDGVGWLREPRGSVRAAQVDLDSVYDPDVSVFRRNVDRMVAKIRSIGATHVFLQACPDSAGSPSVTPSRARTISDSAQNETPSP